MIPQGGSRLALSNSGTSTQTSRTYRLDPERNRIGGFVDGLDAMKQFVFKTLSTRRFEHVIYSGNIGHEIVPGVDRVIFLAEVRRWLEEALLHDDRILSLENMSVMPDGEKVEVGFTVISEFGAFTERRILDV